MGKGRILVFLRVSTEAQELDNQRKEMQDFVKSMGYNDVIYVEGIGASAIKINDEYKAMYDEVKSHIDKRDISAVAVWHVNRLSRSEEWFIKFKNLFIDNKIQFIVKNPTLCLLNEDGSVNAGSELALSLFSTMAKQDMLEKKAKFARTKKAYAKQGKYSGGNTLRFGYYVDDNLFFVENKEESKIIRLIFQLYSTGEYSCYSLAKELNSRGYTRKGVPFDRRIIAHILKSKCYTGEPDEKHSDRVYPQLITKELYDVCQSIASSNKIILRQGEKLVLCSKLIRCPECGTVMSSNSTYFRCNYYIEHKCSNSLTVKEDVVNLVSWRVAFDEHLKYLIEMRENDSAVYNERLSVIEQKVNTLQSIISESDNKKKRVIDSFIEGYINQKERDLRLSKVQDDIVIHHKEINALEEEKSAILRLLENADKELNEFIDIDTMNAMSSNIQTDEDRQKIIRKHILKIVPGRHQYGEKAKGVNRINGVSIDVYTVKGEVHKHIYLPMAKKGNNLLTYHNDKSLWLGEIFQG